MPKLRKERAERISAHNHEEICCKCKKSVPVFKFYKNKVYCSDCKTPIQLRNEARRRRESAEYIRQLRLSYGLSN